MDDINQSSIIDSMNKTLKIFEKKYLNMSFILNISPNRQDLGMADFERICDTFYEKIFQDKINKFDSNASNTFKTLIINYFLTGQGHEFEISGDKLKLTKETLLAGLACSLSTTFPNISTTENFELQNKDFKKISKDIDWYIEHVISVLTSNVSFNNKLNLLHDLYFSYRIMLEIELFKSNYYELFKNKELSEKIAIETEIKLLKFIKQNYDSIIEELVDTEVDIGEMISKYSQEQLDFLINIQYLTFLTINSMTENKYLKDYDNYTVTLLYKINKFIEEHEEENIILYVYPPLKDLLVNYSRESKKSVLATTSFGLANVHFRIKDLKIALQQFLSHNPEISKKFQIIKNIDLSSYGEGNNLLNKIGSFIEKVIQESSKNGFVDVSLSEMKQDAKDKLINEHSIEKQNQLKSYINRIDFYLKEMNPFKVQAGSGIFKGAHILFYKNGTVAIDRLNGQYGYLYIMPINTYFEIIKSTKINNLIEIRNIVTVKAISHKRDNWKEEAKDYIHNHSITEEEFQILTSISGIIMPVTETELNLAREKFKNNQFILDKILEKEEEKNRRYKEIDKELKAKDNSNYEEEKDEHDPTIKKAEEEIIEKISNHDDFISIFDLEIDTKTQRCAKVSLDTKRRTCGENGAMKCEMCGEFESVDTREFESHHIIPISQGGVDNLYNTVCLCGNCHNKMHSKIPFTMSQRWKMLMTIRKNLEKSTPQYVRNFDRLFNPYYNLIYHQDEELTDEEIITLYKKEEEYYNEHKEEEDKKFLTEWNSHRK